MSEIIKLYDFDCPFCGRHHYKVGNLGIFRCYCGAATIAVIPKHNQIWLEFVVPKTLWVFRGYASIIKKEVIEQ